MSEIQLLLCGANEVDVEDWCANTIYAGGFAADSPTVVRPWALEEVLDQSPRRKHTHTQYNDAVGIPRARRSDLATLQQQKHCILPTHWNARFGSGS